MALQRITYEEAGSNLVMVVSAPVAGWRSKAKLPPAIRNFLGMNLFFEETLKFYALRFIKFNHALSGGQVYTPDQPELILGQLQQMMQFGELNCEPSGFVSRRRWQLADGMVF